MKSAQEMPWEDAYSRCSTESIWGPPCLVYDDVIPLLPRRASVFDAGCGDGRHSLMFAKLGFRVTAVDISPSAILNLNRAAIQQGVTLTTHLEDITSFKFDGEYDLILAHGVLHLLPIADACQVIERFKASTRAHGMNVIVVVTDGLSLPDSAKRYMIGLFEDGALCSHYRDWSIIVDHAYSQPRTSMTPFSRHFNRLVAIKPGCLIL